MSGLSCPYCRHPETSVYDSRSRVLRHGTRRRRICAACRERFTTLELTDVELNDLIRQKMAILLTEAPDLIVKAIFRDAREDAIP